MARRSRWNAEHILASGLPHFASAVLQSRKRKHKAELEMKFTAIGEITCTVQTARRWRRMIRRGELPEGVYADLSVETEYERGLVRKYPIRVEIRAYEITEEAMRALQSEAGLWPTDTPTMGTLGADGGIGWAPAVCFDVEASDNESFGSVYVTPWPETVRPITRGHSWERVARAVVNTFQN